MRTTRRKNMHAVCMHEQMCAAVERQKTWGARGIIIITIINSIRDALSGGGGARGQHLASPLPTPRN